MTRLPLSYYSDAHVVLPQKMVPIQNTAAASSPPSGIVAIPANARYLFQVQGNAILLLFLFQYLSFLSFLFLFLFSFLI